VRRKFYDIQGATGSPLAAEALRRIAALYEIEADIRGHPAGYRCAVRHQRSRPLVEALRAWLAEQLERVSGRSSLAKAIRYALSHWNGLILFLDDGRLELDPILSSAPCARSHWDGKTRSSPAPILAPTTGRSSRH
jgi:hypothetical protein